MEKAYSGNIDDIFKIHKINIENIFENISNWNKFFENERKELNDLILKFVNGDRRQSIRGKIIYDVKNILNSISTIDNYFKSISICIENRKSKKKKGSKKETNIEPSIIGGTLSLVFASVYFSSASNPLINNE